MADAVMERPVEMVVDRYGRAAAIAALVVTFGWHVGNDLRVTLAGWSGYHPAALVGSVWLGYLVVGVVFGAGMLRGHRPGRLSQAVVIPLLLLGSVLVQYAYGRAPMFAEGNWGWSAVCWFAMLVLWHRDVKELVAFALANATISAAAFVYIGQADRVGLSRFIMVAYGISVLPVTVFVGGRVLAITAGRVARARDAQARVDTARLAAEAAHQARAARFRAARQASARLLAELASGAADLDSPRTQARCRIAAARLRRLIAETDDVTDPLVHELRACADTAERRGVEVDLTTIGCIPPLPVAVRRALTDPPIEVLAAARSRARITVVAAPDDVAVAVVADGPVPVVESTMDTVTTSVDREGGLVWVQTHWQGR